MALDPNLIENEDVFEDLMTDLVNAVFNPLLPAKRFGRKGQSQDGIDISWFTDDELHRAAQCKFYLRTKLKEEDISADLLRAHEIKPPLRSLTFMTAGRRDRKLTDFANSQKLHGRTGAVDIWFWEDIERRLEMHDLAMRLVGPLIQKHMGQYLREQDMALVPVDSLASHFSGSSNDSPQAQRAERLFNKGRFSEVVEYIKSLPDRLDQDLELILARAYYQRGEHNKVLDLVRAGTCSARLYALASIVYAHVGESEKSIQAQKAARLGAKEQDLAYVTALGLSAFRLRDGLDYESMLSKVPSSLEQHFLIQSVLGDCAQREGLDATAVRHYRNAIACEDKPNLIRQMALQAARLSAVSSKLPHADLVMKSDGDLAELREIKEELSELLNEQVDPQILGIIYHNLSIVTMLFGDAASSERFAQDAVRCDPGSTEFWLRYVFMVSILGGEVDDELVDDVPRDNPQIQMMLADIEGKSGNISTALARLESLRDVPGLGQKALAMIDAQAIELASVGALDEKGFERLLAKATDSKFPAPYLTRAISGSKQPKNRIDSLRKALDDSDFEETEVDERIALAGMLFESGCGSLAFRFLADIRQGLVQARGDFDPSIAQLVLRLLIQARRLEEARKTSEEWCKSDPSSALARALRTDALVNSGMVEIAVSELVENPEILKSSPSLLAQTVALSRLCGRLHKVRRLIKAIGVPTPHTTAERRLLWFALQGIKDKARLEQLALESLRSNADLGVMASDIVHSIASGGAGKAPESVSESCLVAVLHPTQGELHYWVGDSEPPVPGVSGGIWLNELLGLSLGDQLLPSTGPFAGVTLQIKKIKSPTLLLNEYAQQQGRATGNLKGFQGSPQALIQALQKELVEKRESTRKRLEVGAEAGLPAVVMGEVFGLSPRLFIASSGGWEPRCRSGLKEDLDSEQERFDREKSSNWIVDAVTICVIVESQLEDFFPGLLVTPATKLTLKQWYLIERDSLSASGSIRALDNDQVLFEEHDSRSRRAHREHWRKIWKFLESCKNAPAAEDNVAEELAFLSETFDIGTLSALEAAKSSGISLLSDELAVREVAAIPQGISAASLLPFLMSKFNEPSAGRANHRVKVVSAFARLCRLGRQFRSIPVTAPMVALHAPSAERWELLRLLLPTLKNSNPEHWAHGILALQHNMVLRRTTPRLGVNPKKLRQLVLRSMPPLSPAQYRGLSEEFKLQSWDLDRATRRALTYWMMKKGRE